MTTEIREFHLRDPLTGDPVFGAGGKMSTVSGTASIKLDDATTMVLITTDSSTCVFALNSNPTTASLPPPARGVFQMVIIGKGRTLYFLNA